MRKTIFNRYTYKLFFVLLLWGTLSSCEEDQAPDITDDNAMEFQGNSAVIKSENLSNMRFKNLPGTIAFDESVTEGQVLVKASADLDQWLEAKAEGGELRIEGKNGLPASLDLRFHLHPRDIRKIVVEGDDRLYIASTPVLDYLELVTEGESELVIEDLKVRTLKSRREGKSRMLLSSELLGFNRDRLFFRSGDVEVIEGKYIVYRENEVDYLLLAPQITVRNDTVFALGVGSNPLRSFFITGTHELVNQGESYLDALELPTIAVTSKNEGESESSVWAVGQLNVKGEGESVMYYHGFPVVDKDMKGSSKLVQLP